MTTPETRCTPKHPTLRSDRMRETKGGPDNARTLPGPDAHGSPTRPDVSTMDKDSESPARGVDEGLRETFLSIGCDLDGHPQNHAHQCTGRPALTVQQLADAWARRADVSSDGLRDALWALADAWDTRAAKHPSAATIGLTLGLERCADDLRRTLLAPTDRPAGDA